MKLIEGVYDPGILKAVFMAGGVGSGKTKVARAVLGIPDSLNFSYSGIKFIDSDAAYTKFLKQAGYGTKLDKMSKKEFEWLSGYTNDPNSPRNKAKEVVKKMFAIYTKGRLGVLIDGTSKNPMKIGKLKKVLEDMGYDTHLLFINTSLEKAMERNKKRARTLPDDVVIESWHIVQGNLGTLQGIFGGNMLIINNTEDVEKGKFLKLSSHVQKEINRLFHSPIKNYKGRQWIDRQLELKRGK